MSQQTRQNATPTVAEAKPHAGGRDVTPTWESLMPVLVAAAAQGNEDAMLELIKLARVVDKHIAELGAIRDGLAADAGVTPEKARQIEVCPDCGIRGAHALGCPLGPEPLE